MDPASPTPKQQSILIGLNISNSQPFLRRILYAMEKCKNEFSPCFFISASKNRPLLPWEQLEVDGVIGFHVPQEALPPSRVHLPFLLVSNQLEAPGVPRVVSDDRTVGQLAAEHLVAAGAGQLVGVEWTGFHYSRLRLDGFASAAEELGVRCRIHWLKYPQDLPAVDFSSYMRKKVQKVFQHLPPSPGIFVPSDDRLGLILDFARQMGLSAPDDFLVIGVDDQGADPNHPLSKTSSIALDAETIGRTAVQIMAEWIRSGVSPSEDILVSPLGVSARASTSPDPGNAALIRRALARIDSGKYLDDTVDTLAQFLGVSRAGLYRKFEQQLSRTPKEVLHQSRMDAARKLLTSTGLSVVEIAARCGFAHASSFVRAFRTETGFTPAKWRVRSGER